MISLGNELADTFAMLHPATLPMLQRMFEDFRRDAEDDTRPELVVRAERAIEAVRLVIASQTSLES